MIQQFINNIFSQVNAVITKVFFFDVLFFVDGIKCPLIVFVIFTASVIFTIKMRFVNFRLFFHAIKLVVQSIKATSTEKLGEISHFKALSTALSATVGLGNIAGVAVAIIVGGPGATFWMIVMGLLGMNVKFTECTLGVMYREKRLDGKLMGGPMVYLQKGLSEIGFSGLGRLLAIAFCLMCIGGSFGGGTAFQVNQSMHAVAQIIPAMDKHGWIYGIIMTLLVSSVILKGIKSIAVTASRIVPFMCGMYILMSLFILIAHYDHIPQALWSIIEGAFYSPVNSAYGGFIGVLVTGVQRAAFSNEAGLGSAAIAHSVAKVKHPVEEGSVALLEPFIDTVCICTMTALVIIITGVVGNPDYADLVSHQKGAALTSQAMGEVVSWFPILLSVAVFLFAFSTIISWAYYGERCFVFLFSDSKSFIYKIILLVIVFMSSIATSKNAIQFSDLMILSMALPNLIGVLLLSGKVKEALRYYLQKIKK